MIFDWLNAEKEEQFGRELAAFFVQVNSPTRNQSRKTNKTSKLEVMNKMFQRIDRYKLQNKLNFYKKSKFGNSFQWALIDAGIDQEFAKHLTKELLLRL